MAKKTVKECLRSMGLAPEDQGSIEAMANEWAQEQATAPTRAHYVMAVESMRDGADEQLSEIEKQVRGRTDMTFPQPTEQDSRPISTITSKPIPTDEEKFAMSGQAVRTVGPIAGDIAMTAITPQFKGPQLAFRAANALLRAGGSAAGAGLGAKAGDILSGDQRDTATPAMAMGAGWELATAAGGAGIKAVGKVAKPVIDVLGDFTTIGKQFKTRALSYLGKQQIALKEEAATRAMKFLDDIAPEYVKKQQVDMPNLGLKLEEAITESREAYGHITDAMVKFAEKNDGLVDLRGVADYVKSIKSIYSELGWQAGKPQARVLKEIKDANGDVTPAQAEFLAATIFKSGKRGDYFALTPTQQMNREKLKAALLDDLDDISAVAGKTAGDLKREADETFKALKQFEKVQNIYKTASYKDLDSGKTFIYADALASKIYSEKHRILKEMPDLWPALKAEAEFFKGVAAKSGPIEVAGAFDIFTAWGLLAPRAKEAIKRAVDLGEVFVDYAAKPATKAGLQMAGQQINFGGE